MNEHLNIIECKSNKLWDEFLINSENKNIFSKSIFIKKSKYKSKMFFIKKSDEIVASFNLYLDKKKIINGDRIYSPINFKNFEKKNVSSQNYKKLNVLKIFIEYITKNFTKGEFTLDHHTEDLRPFFWHNFENKKKIFKVDEVRYTSLIEENIEFKATTIEELINSKIFKKFSRSIKQQIKHSIKQKFNFEEDFEFSLMSKILKKTFKRQNKKIDFDLNNYEEIYKKLFSEKNLKMFIIEKDSVKLAFCVFGIIGDKAIYLNGGKINHQNNDYSLTYGLSMSIISLFRSGIKKIDLEGVNSPNRSFWKQGFGGILKPYYKLSIN